MVKVKCPLCYFAWIARPDFEFLACVKCYEKFPSDAKQKCVVARQNCAVGATPEKAKMKARFEKMDVSKDGALDFDEMALLLRKGNPALSDIDLWTVFDGVDKNHDGKIDFGEFYDYLHAPPGVKDSCEMNRGLPHDYKYGKCTYCSQPEPAMTSTAKSHGGQACSDTSRKCQFAFSKCKNCGKNEFPGMGKRAKARGRTYGEAVISADPHCKQATKCATSSYLPELRLGVTPPVPTGEDRDIRPRNRDARQTSDCAADLRPVNGEDVQEGGHVRDGCSHTRAGASDALSPLARCQAPNAPEPVMPFTGAERQQVLSEGRVPRNTARGSVANDRAVIPHKSGH